MINVLIIEDEPTAARRIIKLLEETDGITKPRI